MSEPASSLALEEVEIEQRSIKFTRQRLVELLRSRRQPRKASLCLRDASRTDQPTCVANFSASFWIGPPGKKYSIATSTAAHSFATSCCVYSRRSGSGGFGVSQNSSKNQKGWPDRPIYEVIGHRKAEERRRRRRSHGQRVREVGPVDKRHETKGLRKPCRDAVRVCSHVISPILGWLMGEIQFNCAASSKPPIVMLDLGLLRLPGGWTLQAEQLPVILAGQRLVEPASYSCAVFARTLTETSPEAG